MSFNVVILAAGQGKRMKSSLPKALFPIAGLQALKLLIRTAGELKPSKIILVVSPAMKESIEEIVKSEKCGVKIEVVYQKSLNGTAGSLLAAKNYWMKSKNSVLVLNGDVPLVRCETLKSIIDSHRQNSSKATVTTTNLPDPSGYGRIIRSHAGDVCGIVEDGMASAAEKETTEINTGCYVFEPEAISELLSNLKPSKGGEIYLTDLIKEIVDNGGKVSAYNALLPEEFLGMNSRRQHAELCKIMQRRINDHWMDNGVSILSPESTWIDSDVKLGTDIVLSSNVHLVGNTSIGSGVSIEPNCIIRNSKIGDGCLIRAGSYIEESVVKSEAQIGPYARLRPETKIGKGAKVGNFVELKKTELGDGSKANHLTYLGDAIIGKNSNIGAGVITCNYDGGLRYKGKAKTIVGNNAFVGSDVQLIAPVKVSDHAYVASGSSISSDVPPYALAIARARQENKINFIKKLNKRKKR